MIYLSKYFIAGGGEYLEILHTPGHTKGSICISYPHKKALFTGRPNVFLSPTPQEEGNILKFFTRRVIQKEASVFTTLTNRHFLQV